MASARAGSVVVAVDVSGLAGAARARAVAEAAADPLRLAASLTLAGLGKCRVSVPAVATASAHAAHAAAAAAPGAAVAPASTPGVEKAEEAEDVEDAGGASFKPGDLVELRTLSSRFEPYSN